MDRDKLYELSTSILKFYEGHTKIKTAFLYKKLSSIYEKREIEIAIEFMTAFPDPSLLRGNDHDCIITGYGHYINSIGGYEGLWQNELSERERQDERAKIQKAIDQSIIDTNESVKDVNEKTKRNYNFQVFNSFITIMLAGITLWYVVLTYNRDNIKDELTRSQENIQRLQVVIDSLLYKQSATTPNDSLASSDSVSTTKPNEALSN